MKRKNELSVYTLLYIYMRKLLFIPIFFCALMLSAQGVFQWRGDRSGVYNETGLLTSWPANGPKLLWHYDGLGEGFTSVAIADEKIYLTGLTGDKGYLYVLDMKGNLLSKKAYGTEWNRNHDGSRSTVAINEGKLYVYSGTGNLICLNQNTLDVIWKKNIETDFDGKNIMWGVNESSLIVDDKIILTPGGKKHNMVALNKNDGLLIWSCPADGDASSYCSPLYIADGQVVPQVVTMMASHIVGVDISNGQKLWSYKYENFRKIHPNTPLYSDNMLLCTSGYGKGSVMLRLTNGGRSVEKVWETKELETKHGGIVKIGDYVYGSGDDKKFWYCLEWNTGKTKYADKSLGVGVTIAADGMLYCYSEKGDMALVKQNPEKFEIISKFPVKLGTGPHWAHPVIHNGVLYVRHGNTLMAYQLKVES